MKKYLIVGLGNIGEEYRYTRHNIGFLAVEDLAKQKEVEFTTVRLNLAFGSIRIKKKGSDGGHNGFKNIQEELQTTSYARLRFGISANYAKGTQIDYVLGRWSEEEVALLPERLEKISEAILSFGLAGADTTMNLYNNK